MLTTSCYFSWYLLKAYDHAGLSDSYLSRMNPWRDMEKLNYTIWPEVKPGPIVMPGRRIPLRI